MTMHLPDLGFEAAASPRRWWFGRCRPLPTAAALLALATALAALGASAFAAWNLRQELLQARLKLTVHTPAPSARGPAASPRPADGAAWNEAVQRLNTPWSALLDTLEDLATPDVALVSLEPDGRSHRVRLQAEARDLPTLLDYAERLRAAPGIHRVNLLRHETNEPDPARPVRLTLDVDPGLAAPAQEAPLAQAVP